MKRIVFDIETEPITLEFKNATSTTTKIKLAPRMRVACTFDESRSAYRYFSADDGKALVKLLQSADEVVSFNGKHFDLLVLRRHYGLKGRVPLRGKHVDLHEIITQMASFRVSLDRAARLNLGERKHTDGRNMDALNLDQLKAACRSDVCQTHQIFLRYVNDTLLIPENPWTKGVDSEKSYSDAPHSCPSCHALNCLEEIEWDTSGMTDGQLSDYCAGFYGSAECRRCGDIIDWGI